MLCKYEKQEGGAKNARGWSARKRTHKAAPALSVLVPPGFKHAFRKMPKHVPFAGPLRWWFARRSFSRKGGRGLLFCHGIFFSTCKAPGVGKRTEEQTMEPSRGRCSRLPWIVLLLLMLLPVLLSPPASRGCCPGVRWREELVNPEGRTGAKSDSSARKGSLSGRRAWRRRRHTQSQQHTKARRTAKKGRPAASKIMRRRLEPEEEAVSLAPPVESSAHETTRGC